MANLCNRCGQILPREDSRFCSRCGADLSPKANSSPIPRRTQVITGQNSSPSSGESSGARPVLREQIAFPPPPSPTTPAVPDDVPPWLSRLDRIGVPPVSRPGAPGFSPDTPPKIGSTSAGAGRPPSPNGSRVQQRELRARVYENSPDLDSSVDQRDNTVTFSKENRKEEQAPVPPIPSLEQTGESSEVEDQPTVPVPSASAGEKAGRSSSPVAQNEQSESGTTRSSEKDKVDTDLPTRPLIASLSVPEQVYAQRTSERPFPAQSYRQRVPPQSQPGSTRDQQQQGFSGPVGPNPGQPLVRQQPMMSPVPPSSPGFQPSVAAQAPATVERAAGPVSSRPGRRKGKLRLVVVLVMLLVLLGGGLIYWLVAYQPFSVPAVTSTSLSFSNASLGIALQYPQGWTNRLDAAHQTVSFFDAGQIDQLTISVASSNGASAATYASKEAGQFGLTAQKSLSPVAFAGTTWQRVQGTLMVSGATDTETVLVAQHGNRLYTIAQIAPAATYADADSLFFSIFRANFHFL